ncbi:MAG: efflux RND transporter periplasmic adaptor subunit [Ramlibacter sp.]
MRWSIFATAAVLAAAALFFAWRAWSVTEVPLVAVARGHVIAQVTGPGTVQARVPVTISSRITSTVVGVAVDVGDLVQPGQLLVTLEGGDLASRHAAVRRQQESIARQVDAAAAGVDKARADVELARMRTKRDSDLHAKGFVSQAALDVSVAGARASEAGLQSAEATRAARQADLAALSEELAIARAQAGYARLNAPMAGHVVQRLVEPGSTVGPGVPILRLVDPATLWVGTRVDEAMVERIAVGQPAMIRLRSGSVLAGRVERIALQSDAATRELEVYVAFAGPPPRVAIDQEAEVRIDVGSEEGLVLPASAITPGPGGQPGVLKVVEGRTRFVPVRVGPEAQQRVLVLAGLAAGDTVVARAADAKAGQRILSGPSLSTGKAATAWNSP